MAHPAWLTYLPTCPSTNDWAKDHLQDLGHGHVVWTEQQTAGRGQHDRRWLSPAGTLTVSIIVELAPGPRLAQLGLIAGLALAHAVEDACPDLQVAIKWPNDCYLSGRKLAGILCEAKGSHQGLKAVVGIGCNISADFSAFSDADWPDLVHKPISIDELSPPPTPLELTSAIRRYLLEGVGMLTADGWPRLLPELRRRDHLLDKPILVVDQDQRHRGIAAGLDDDGRLLLARPDGGLHPIDRGQVRDPATERP
jgi:BirA family biotin operon repressor/biotin-[acetyl-CoA-carboxylase] ligase